MRAATKKSPGVVRGFAIGGLAAFLATGIVVSLLMVGYVRHRAEALATFHAEFVTSSVLRPAPFGVSSTRPARRTAAPTQRQASSSRAPAWSWGSC